MKAGFIVGLLHRLPSGMLFYSSEISAVSRWVVQRFQSLSNTKVVNLNFWFIFVLHRKCFLVRFLELRVSATFPRHSTCGPKVWRWSPRLSNPKAGSKPCQNNPPTARQSHRIRPVLSSGSTPHMHLPACLEYSEGWLSWLCQFFHICKEQRLFYSIWGRAAHLFSLTCSKLERQSRETSCFLISVP